MVDSVQPSTQGIQGFPAHAKGALSRSLKARRAVATRSTSKAVPSEKARAASPQHRRLVPMPASMASLHDGFAVADMLEDRRKVEWRGLPAVSPGIAIRLVLHGVSRLR